MNAITSQRGFSDLVLNAPGTHAEAAEAAEAAEEEVQVRLQVGPGRMCRRLPLGEN